MTVDIALIIAVMHTPREIIFVGTFGNKWDTQSALDDASEKYIKANPGILRSDIYLDWFNSDTENYQIADYESFKERHESAEYEELQCER